ncbi:hypothetical protein SBC1_02570 [Caballeronia sp. SBC1]|nr:hypothetical protein SBC1_02570 [Caballeronia sp. SBC1]
MAKVGYLKSSYPKNLKISCLCLDFIGVNFFCL